MSNYKKQSIMQLDSVKMKQLGTNSTNTLQKRSKRKAAPSETNYDYRSISSQISEQIKYFHIKRQRNCLEFNVNKYILFSLIINQNKMSRTISEQSIQDSRYKTIVSEQRTRNPTTTKKNQLSPSEFKRSYYQSPFIEKIKKANVFRKKSDPIRQSLTLLQSRKERYIQQEKYKEAMKISRKISRTRSLITETQLKQLKKDQVNEDKSIKSAYNHQVHYFQQAWSLFIQKSKEKERQHINQFKIYKNKLADRSKSLLVKKCHSLKNKSAEIIQLQRQQKHYKKKGDIEQLSLIKQQKKKIKEKIRKERQSLIMKWTKDEEVLWSRNQSKKYQALLHRLKQQRRDQQRTYMQEKSRLKQKFKNVISQLKHQQKMILNFANMRIDQIKIN